MDEEDESSTGLALSSLFSYPSIASLLLFLFTYLLVAPNHISFFPLGRVGGAMLGASLSLLLQLTSMEEVIGGDFVFVSSSLFIHFLSHFPSPPQTRSRKASA